VLPIFLRLVHGDLSLPPYLRQGAAAAALYMLPIDTLLKPGAVLAARLSCASLRRPRSGQIAPAARAIGAVTDP